MTLNTSKQLLKHTKTIMITILVISIASLYLAILSPPKYKTQVRLLYTEENKLIEKGNTSPIDTEISLLRSTTIYKNVKDTVNRLNISKQDIDKRYIDSNIKIYRENNSNVINIDFISESRQLVLAISKVYTHNAINENIKIHQLIRLKKLRQLKKQIELSTQLIKQYQRIIGLNNKPIKKLIKLTDKLKLRRNKLLTKYQEIKLSTFFMNGNFKVIEDTSKPVIQTNNDYRIILTLIGAIIISGILLLLKLIHEYKATYSELTLTYIFIHLIVTTSIGGVILSFIYT